MKLRRGRSSRRAERAERRLASEQAEPDGASEQAEPDGAIEQAERSAEQVERERALLAELCVDMHDRVPAEGLRDKLRLGLGRVGIEIIAAGGQSFDPVQHEALGTVPTDEHALVETVASTQRSGYSDRGRLVREPGVLVYQLSDDDPQR